MPSGRLGNRSGSFCEFQCFLRITRTQTNLRKHPQRDAVFAVDAESLTEELLSFFVTILSHQQRGESGIGKRPVFLVGDGQTKCSFRFRQTSREMRVHYRVGTLLREIQAGL